MAEATLKAQIREQKGKQASKRFRYQGMIPGILYGADEEPMLLKIDLKELLLLLHSFGRNIVVNLAIGNKRKKIMAFIFDIQHNPISGNIIHIDLKHISLKEKIHVSVPVHLSGDPEGVRNEGGIVEHIMHKLEIISLPADIPEEIIIDIADLHIGDVIRVKDIAHGKFDIIPEPESTVVHLIAPKVVLVPEDEVSIEEEEETAEPEVIGEEE